MIFAVFTEGPVAELFAGTLPKAFCSDILIWNKVCLTLTKAACLLSADRRGVGGEGCHSSSKPVWCPHPLLPASISAFLPDLRPQLPQPWLGSESVKSAPYLKLPRRLPTTVSQVNFAWLGQSLSPFLSLCIPTGEGALGVRPDSLQVHSPWPGYFEPECLWPWCK